MGFDEPPVEKGAAGDGGVGVAAVAKGLHPLAELGNEGRQRQHGARDARAGWIGLPATLGIEDVVGRGGEAGGEVVGHGGEFKGGIAAGAEALPFVFKDVVDGPAFLVGVGAFDRHANEFSFAFVVEVNGLVIDPIGPVLGEGFVVDLAATVLAELHDLAVVPNDARAGF